MKLRQTEELRASVTQGVHTPATKGVLKALTFHYHNPHTTLKWTGLNGMVGLKSMTLNITDTVHVCSSFYYLWFSCFRSSSFSSFVSSFNFSSESLPTSRKGERSQREAEECNRRLATDYSSTAQTGACLHTVSLPHNARTHTHACTPTVHPHIYTLNTYML